LNIKELRYLLALLETTDLVFRFGHKLLSTLPSIEEFFTVPTRDLVKSGLPQEEVAKLKNPNWCAVEHDLRWAEAPENHLLAFTDQSYSTLLAEIPSPPLLLFATGDLHLLKSKQIAIVGSRNPTPFGVETAFEFAENFAQVGLTITSGFASGIDAASHKGAIAGSGKTVAVMGTGLNNLYPTYHKNLAREIVEYGGLLLSEFPLQAKGNAWHFPLRNRIISGLSIGTLVVEATMRSGSLITARLATEQGRDVFAIPGSIYNPLSRGCHHLIRQGAKLVEQPSDVLEEFDGLLGRTQPPVSDQKTSPQKNKLDREHCKLLNCIGFEITTVDSLARRTGLPVQKVSAMLLELELQGFIRVVDGGYVRVKRVN